MEEASQATSQWSNKPKINWYRSPIEREVLRKLTKRSDAKGLFQAGGHLLLLICTGMLIYFFFNRESWIAFAILLSAHGTVARFAGGAPTHELSHGTVFKTKWLNAAFLRIYALIGWRNFHAFEISHTLHHKYTLHREADGEVILPKTPSLAVFYMLQLFGVNLFGGFESRGIFPVVFETVRTAVGKTGKGEFAASGWLSVLLDQNPESRRLAIRWARIILLFNIVVIVVSLALRLWLIPILVCFPWCIGNWSRYFIGVTMHCGLRDNVPDFRKCVRSVTTDPVTEFLYWHMNWHTEHHMFAAVPCYNLRRLSREIAFDLPKPRTLIGAWREMRATWKRQKIDPDYQFDTPIPLPNNKAS